MSWFACIETQIPKSTNLPFILPQFFFFFPLVFQKKVSFSRQFVEVSKTDSKSLLAVALVEVYTVYLTV